MKNKKKLLSGPYLFWAVSFIIIPLFMILYYGLTDNDGKFTFMNLAAITTPENLKALGLALLLSFVSTVICLLLAYPLAMILAGRDVNQTSFVVLVFILPMWMNFLLRTLAWQNLLEKTGVINSVLHFLNLPSLNLINTPGAIILGMVYNFLPFMILPIYNVLVKIDKDVISAAKRPGCRQPDHIYQDHPAAQHSGHHQRNHDGIRACADHLRYLELTRRKQDPAHRQRHRAGIPAGKQLACGQRTFSGPDGIYYCKYGTDCQIR